MGGAGSRGGGPWFGEGWAWGAPRGVSHAAPRGCDTFRPPGAVRNEPTGHRPAHEPGFPPYLRLRAIGAGGIRSPDPARALKQSDPQAEEQRGAPPARGGGHRHRYR
ncbi:hypothetical protein GCM10018785_13510 [Streptomyces longispororuber]|uniref:Uncharacterized protein n=1 Tax=Streptomyces longispororuber TaxID=68230 RepID=A0A918ZD47_9ACTN|nr:hypothetical protein GCM10018785_13510 [Streptomyces longispororuber]